MGLSPAGNKIQQHIIAQSLSKSPSHQPDMAEKKQQKHYKYCTEWVSWLPEFAD